VNWVVQSNPPNILSGTGWKTGTLRVGMDVCVEGFPQKHGAQIFDTTSFTLKTTGQNLKTPAGAWIWPSGADAPEISYIGKTSCAKPDPR